MSALIKITYPAENQILHPGGLSIRGIGPAGKKIRIALKEFDWLAAFWDTIVGKDGYWDASGAIVKNGTWNVDVMLLSELPLPREKDHITFRVTP